MKYDTLIVGASIAGLYTGMKLAETGQKVCILDRKKEIGLPVRCGEATGNRVELARFVDIDESWIARDIRGFSVHCGENTFFEKEMKDTGVILKRDLFEKYMAEKAETNGAEVILGTAVSGLLHQNDSITGVLCDDGREMTGSLVIGADGCESKIGRWAGITRTVPIRDAFSALQYRVKSDYCNDGFLHFFIGSHDIPGGYIWVFPRSENEISIGAGLYRGNGRSQKVKPLLDDFITRNIPEAQCNHFITGCAPLSICPKLMHNNNVLVVGDAARQVNPLTAGGIMNALEAADLAVKAILAGKNRAKRNTISDGYSKTWARTQRRQQKIYYLFKEIYLDSSDREMKLVTEKVGKIFSSKRRIDRSKPFVFPIFPLISLFLFLFKKFIKHLNVLWM